jgi:hypothetical protein
MILFHSEETNSIEILLRGMTKIVLKIGILKYLRNSENYKL